MGPASLGLGWRVAAAAFGAPPAIGETILAISALTFLTLAVRYVRKAVRAPASVRAEFADPFASSYFATVTIALALYADALVPYAHVAALCVWAIAACGSLVLLFALVRAWFVEPRTLTDMTPALYLPVAGIAVPVYAAVPIGFAEAAWALLAIAIVCWLTVQPLVFHRLFFDAAIPVLRRPALGVLVSSPAVFATAWFALRSDRADPVFRILAWTSLFFAVLVVLLTPLAFRAAFSVGWWGYTFPSAALAGAFVRYDLAVHTPLSRAMGWTLLTIATAIALYVAARSFAAAAGARRSAAPRTTRA